MFVEVAVTFIILLLCNLIYSFWIKPRSIMKTYAKQLRNQGYKILQCSYNPFRHDLIEAINKGVREGDAMKVFKEQRKDYDVIVTNSLNRPKLEFNHPDFIKDFYSVDKHYEYPKEQKVVNLITRASGRSQLSSSEGPEWKRKRTIFNKIFNFDFIQSQALKIAKLSDEAIKQEQRKGKINPTDNSVSFHIFQLTTRIFSSVMMEIFLGGTGEETIENQPAGLFLSKLIQDTSQQIMKPLSYIFGKRYLALGITKEQRDVNERLKVYKKWATEFVSKRVQKINAQLELKADKTTYSDIIEGLVIANRKVKSGQSDQETISSADEIVDDFTSFYIAGIQTTATFTQMMIYYIAMNPRIEEKVRSEIKQFMSTDDYSYQNLKNLTYIDLLQKQTTRYFGPGTQLFPRIAANDNFLNRLPVRKGTQVLIMHMGNHYSQKYFKNPKQFRPERWESECKDIPPFVCGGFSAGARSCIGKHLAMLDSKIALIKFLKRYSKIILPKTDFKIGFTFSVYPEEFPTKLIINQDSKSENK